MTLRFAVVHEAPADFEMATELADRVLLESIDWLNEELLIHQRNWLGEYKAGLRLTWTGITKLALKAKITAIGHYDGNPALPDAHAARRAIRFLRNEFPDLDAIVLIRDRDDEKERRGGLEQARQASPGVPIVVGFAIVERECWVLSGFDPASEAETDRLEAERRTLGFDPRVDNHQLTACKDDQAKRSPKRVLRQLCEGDSERERRCWKETSLSTLRERGAANGLTEFLEEVRTKLASLIGHVSENGT